VVGDAVEMLVARIDLLGGRAKEDRDREIESETE
jgi:hypothetical protein